MRAALSTLNLFVLVLVSWWFATLNADKPNDSKEILIKTTKERITDGELRAKYLHFLDSYPFSKRLNNATDFVKPPKKVTRHRSLADIACYISIVCGICRGFGSCGAAKPKPTPEPIVKINNTVRTYDDSYCVCTCKATCSQPECPELPPKKDVCAVFPACDSHCDLVIEPLGGRPGGANSSESKQEEGSGKGNMESPEPYRGIDKLKSVIEKNFKNWGKLGDYVGMLQPDMKLLHNIDQKLIDDIKYVIAYHKDRLPNGFPGLLNRRFDWTDRDAKYLGSFITGSLSVFGHLLEQLQEESHRRRRSAQRYEASCKCNMNCTVKASNCRQDCENKSNCNKASCVC